MWDFIVTPRARLSWMAGGESRGDGGGIEGGRGRGGGRGLDFIATPRQSLQGAIAATAVTSCTLLQLYLPALHLPIDTYLLHCTPIRFRHE